MSEQPLELFNLPGDFSLKVMGRDNEAFELLVLETIVKAGCKLKENALSKRSSQKGNFVAITITFYAEHETQVQEIYQILNNHELVLMTL
jgi:uncharacterized protein